MSAENAVNIQGLVKRYKTITALKGIDITIGKGVIFGLLGPNGAGKSTLIKVLVGALRPTFGSVKVLNFDPIRQRFCLSKKLGYMPQSPALYDDLSARENIRFFGRLQRVKDLELKIEQTLNFTELEDRADDLVHTFSGGMKKRVSLACALIHEPDIIFLDEPTAAVDPHLKVKTWELFNKLCRKGVTLIVSTHLMDEALLCQELAIINQGQIIAHDTPANILQKGSINVVLEKNEKIIEKTTSGLPQDLAKALYEHGLSKDVTKMKVHYDSLETIILRLLSNKDDIVK